MIARSHNMNEINSISANVRISPMPQPPSYDFATKNLEPVENGTHLNYFIQYKLVFCMHMKWTVFIWRRRYNINSDKLDFDINENYWLCRLIQIILFYLFTFLCCIIWIVSIQVIWVVFFCSDQSVPIKVLYNNWKFDVTFILTIYFCSFSYIIRTGKALAKQ